MRRLPAVLGTWFGIAVGVGSMIGAGILRAPHDVALLLPTPALFLLVWVLGGAYALLGANALAELGAMRPRSGGQYAFARQAYGPFPAFVVGWADWLSTCGSNAAVSFVLAETAASLLSTDHRAVVPLALFATALVLASVWRGSKAGDRTQRATSLAKAVAFMTLIVACLGYAALHGRGRPAVPVAHEPAASLMASIVIALQGVIFAYDGWVGILYFAEEVPDAGRKIPRSLFGAVLSVMAIYLLLNLAVLAVLPMSTIAVDPLPAAAAARAVFGLAGSTVVQVVVVVALPSALVANLLMASRVAFAVGRDASGLRSLAHTGSSDSPRVALAISSAVVALLILTGTFERVVAVNAILFVAMYAMSFSAVFVLRRREPDAPRPWRAWAHPWTTALVLAGSLAFLVATALSAPRESLIAGLLVVGSYPVYRVLRGAPVGRQDGRTVGQ